MSAAPSGGITLWQHLANIFLLSADFTFVFLPENTLIGTKTEAIPLSLIILFKVG